MNETVEGSMLLKKDPLIAVVGPTAVGKTELSIRLAETLQGEIINADSMQVYQGMTIGTAKPTDAERARVPHHLIDMLHPTEPWTVSSFQDRALAAISNVKARGKMPIMVGGTGLYVQAITHHLSFSKAESDPAYRQELEMFAQKQGGSALFQLLVEKDPKAAESIHPHNERRVIRALEVLHTTGHRFSEREEEQSVPRFHSALIGLTMDRELLYSRINQRVDRMMELGLVEEVEALYKAGIEGQAIQAIGYKELYAYFNREQSLSQAIDQIKTRSRQYAKRQLTWFKNKSEAEWFDVTSQTIEEILPKVVDFSCRKFKNGLE
ncbi:tRNA (adenosine(37)-N6)-dimethylallyltransferase MiaA [Shouchella miscanthi]|uniref:tRNA dimethylallyltransferase n=1 Tax=Shouchella miscanthi TaxID=2598861 RepID=A0ABU6NG87_9BACI|nr:tRNA (adenosine(37)-N6)-dimethylallyltransferase MiaA [Shouchella miscanthi]MED4127214.1 tRNA (adenosine(37)-N6)-dimethylallyltransferase MiaA [Shouchella miscanthi]